MKVNEQNDKKSDKYDCLSKICVDENGFVEYNNVIRVNTSVVQTAHTLEEKNIRKSKL